MPAAMPAPRQHPRFPDPRLPVTVQGDRKALYSLPETLVPVLLRRLTAPAEPDAVGVGYTAIMLGPKVQSDPNAGVEASACDRLRSDTPLALYYVVDPMCSWCWGFRDGYAALRQRLPEDTAVHYVMGGLAPDSDAPMPESMRERIRQAWQSVSQRTGARFNFDFWERNVPRRSTWPACRAVIAASVQDPDELEPMLEALQRAYYEQARNPAEREILIEVATEIGLDPARFAVDLDSPEVEATLQAQMRWARALGADGFPSLLLESAGRLAWLTRGYADADTLLVRAQAAIDALSEGGPAGG
jgi:putative protein-disulfide isomerase